MLKLSSYVGENESILHTGYINMEYGYINTGERIRQICYIEIVRGLPQLLLHSFKTTIFKIGIYRIMTSDCRSTRTAICT